MGGDIEHQDSSIVSVSSSVKATTQPPEDLNSPVDLSFLNQQATESSGHQLQTDPRPSSEAEITHEEGLQPKSSTSPTDCVQHQLESLTIAKDQSSHAGVEKEGATQIASSHTKPSSMESSIAVTECECNSRKTLVFAKEEFVFQVYTPDIHIYTLHVTSACSICC